MQDQNTPKTTEEQAPRAWVTPSFEQVELTDALSSPPGKFQPLDGGTNYS